MVITYIRSQAVEAYGRIFMCVFRNPNAAQHESVAVFFCSTFTIHLIDKMLTSAQIRNQFMNFKAQTNNYDEWENKCSSIQPSRYKVRARNSKRPYEKLNAMLHALLFIYANTRSDNITISIHFA